MTNAEREKTSNLDPLRRYRPIRDALSQGWKTMPAKVRSVFHETGPTEPIIVDIKKKASIVSISMGPSSGPVRR